MTSNLCSSTSIVLVNHYHTREIGFDDAFQYEDFQKPLDQRRISIQQIFPEIGDKAYRAWMEKPNRHPY